MYKFEDYILNLSGAPINGASVTVNVSGGGLATIYSDDGVTTTANPVTTNSFGRFSFFVADGRYDLVVTGTGLTTYTRSNIEILDATERSSTDIAWAVDSMTTGKWNNVRIVDGGKFATIAAAVTDLPAAGGKVIIPAGATFDATTVSITKPVWLEFLGPAYTFSGTGSAFSVAAEGVRISGAGRPGSGTTQGTVINVSNIAAIGINATNAPGLTLDNFALVGPGSGTGKGIVISGTRPKIDNVLVASFGSDGITLDGSTINTNVGTFTHVRSQNNGGNGWKVLGANANTQTFLSCDGSGNTGDGWNVATLANVFQGTNTDANSSGIGYHFISGGSNNFLVGFSNAPGAPETAAIQFDSGANSNEIHCASANMPINTDNGSGNRYYGCGGTFGFGGATWNRVNSDGFVIRTGPLTLASAATAVRTVTFPDNTGTLAELNLTQTWTADQQVNANLPTRGPDPWIDIRAYGAVGDDATDNTTAIQNAINACPAGGCVIYVPSGIFRHNTAFTVPVNKRIRFTGAGSSSVLKKTAGVNQFTGTGTLSNSTTLTTSLNPGDGLNQTGSPAVIVASTTGFTAGDLIQIADNTGVTNCTGATSNGSCQLELAEIDVVVNATTLQLKAAVDQSYASATGTVQKVTPIFFEMDNMATDGNGFGSFVADLLYGWKCRVTNNRFENGDAGAGTGSGNAFSFRRCKHVLYANNKAGPYTGDLSSGAGSGYGVIPGEASAYINITNSHFSKMREIPVGNLSHHINIVGNTMQGVFDSCANVHGNGSHHVTFSNNICSGGAASTAGVHHAIGFGAGQGASGLDLDHDVIISNNVFTNLNRGVYLNGFTLGNLRNFVVAGNLFDNIVSDSINATKVRGIEIVSNRLRKIGNSNLGGIIVDASDQVGVHSNSLLDAANSTTTYGIFVRSTTQVQVTGNQVIDTTGSTNFEMFSWRDSKNGVFANNFGAGTGNSTIFRFLSSVASATDTVTIANNVTSSTTSIAWLLDDPAANYTNLSKLGNQGGNINETVSVGGGAIAAQTCVDTAGTVKGAATTMKAWATPQGALAANWTNLVWSTYVSAAGMIQVHVCNPTGASVTPTAMNFNIGASS